MKRLFIFDFDDTLANFSMYNTFKLKQPLKFLPDIGSTIPGATDVLDFLKSKKDRLAMLSMNIVLDDDLKWKKLDRLGMGKWFNRKNAYFVRNKTPEKYLDICGRTRLEDCYMVGNSLGHDIYPALEAGINAIYIPRPLATRWIPRSLPKNVRFHKYREIRSIIHEYDRL